MLVCTDDEISLENTLGEIVFILLLKLNDDPVLFYESGYQKCMINIDKKSSLGVSI